MTPIYNIDFFSGELDLINDLTIRDLTRQALEQAPKYIWYVPASITGKHHPPDDNGPGGLCWHLKKTSWLAWRMFHNLMLNTDIGVAAGLLHDICHRGTNDEPEEGYESYQQHGEIVLSRLGKVMLSNDSFPVEIERIWADISMCILSHMGRWGDRQPESIEEITFHLADVAASTKGLINIGYDADILSEYTVPELVGKKEYFIKDSDGDWVFNFGKKHSGHKLSDIATNDDGYLRWMIKQGKQSVNNKDGFPEDVLMMIKQARDQVLLDRKLANKRRDLVDMMEEAKPL